MNEYQKKKQAARDQAIAWQLDFINHDYSYWEIGYFQAHFERLAKRYGLVSEFKENGII